MANDENLYLLEHKVLPNLFYKEPENFVVTLIKNPGVIWEMLNDIYKADAEQNPYSKDQFLAEPFRLYKDILMLRITFPKPSREPLCYYSYIFFDENFTKYNYFCIEKGNGDSEEDDPNPFVCRWDQNDRHYNYGNTYLDPDKSMAACFKLYLDHGVEAVRENNNLDVERLRKDQE